MTHRRLNLGHQRLNAAGRPRGINRNLLRRLPLASAISAILAGGAPLVHAATEAESNVLEEVTVTAQKVTENLQNVPVSIETLGTQKLEQLNIVNLDDYVQYLSGVTTIKSIGQGGNGIGTTHVYMRGINAGQDGNHSGSQPTVGTYLDEQPVTTIDGTVDIHMYDIARIEVLEGPQGTLYGASSEAGTIRIITNKPDPTKFEASYELSGNSVDHGGQGWVAEGFVNIPLSSIAAVRIVGWDEHDPGYINNVAGTNVNAGIVNGVRSFAVLGGPTDATLSNAASVSDNYNTSETKGGRAALKFDLGDMDGDADLHGASPRRQRLFRLRPRGRRPAGRALRTGEHAGLLHPVRADGRGQGERLRYHVFGRLFHAHHALDLGLLGLLLLLRQVLRLGQLTGRTAPAR